MPVEIKELIIRAVTTAGTEESDDQPLREAPQDKDALIQECVRQVLRILQKMKER